MKLKTIILSVLFISSLALIGCGGGGGGGGTTGASTSQNLTISGNVSSPEVNDTLLGSVAGAAGGAIDYSKLTVQISGDDSTKTNPKADGTYTVTATAVSATSVKLEVKNKNGDIILARKLDGVALGQTLSGQTIDATSTAVLLLREAAATTLSDEDVS